MAMLGTILGALLPMVVTFLLGFVAAWRGEFGPKDGAILSRMVLRYACRCCFSPAWLARRAPS
jgi:malonate transporter